MKSIRSYLTVVVLCTCSLQLFSQDEFYPESSQDENSADQVEKAVNSIENQYFTEDDYYQEVGSTTEDDRVNVIFTEDEIYDEEDRRKRRRNSEAAAVAAEIVVDVLVNTLFIVAFFWQ